MNIKDTNPENEGLRTDRLISYTAPLGGFAYENEKVCSAVAAGYRIVDIMHTVATTKNDAYLVITVLLTYTGAVSVYRPIGAN